MAAKPGGTAKKRPQRKNAAQAQHSEPPLSLERIVATAVELLDAHGVDGLTMRRLADRLGAGTMSLYWHVDNKDDVFDLALDAVLACSAPAPVVACADWREEIAHALQDWRAIMLRHPWSSQLLASRTLGPSILARLELLGGILSRAGVADAELNVAIWSLWNYVLGATVTRASFARSQEDAAAAQQRLSTLGYPTIARTRLVLDNDWDGTFRKGLDVLLDGLAATASV